MGKISDIWVRLGLKKEGFDKGMDDAAKKAEGFGGSFKKIKATALAAWAAIGASVIAFGKKMIDTTNAVGDKWAMFTAQAKAGWNTFVQSLSAMDWDNFIGRFREAVGAAKELQSALDAEFEISNSIKLQKAAMEEELNALEILARNASKPYEERVKAAQKYLDMVRPIYEQEMALANKLLDAQQGAWLGGTGLQDTKQTRDDLTKFLVDYGKTSNGLADIIGRMLELQEQYDMAVSVRMKTGDYTSPNKVIDEYRALRDTLKEFEKINGYQTDIYKLAQAYEKLRGDADTQPLVDALIRAGQAAGAFDRETKRMQAALNTSLAQMKEVKTEMPAVYVEDVAGVAGEIEKEVNAQIEEAIAGVETETFEADIKVDVNPAVTGAELSFAEFELPSIDTTDLATGMREVELIISSYQQLLDSVNADTFNPTVDTTELEAAMAKAQAVYAEYQRQMALTQEMNYMLEDSIVASMSNGLQALMDVAAGVEGADMKGALAAFLAPLGDTMKQMGAMIMAEGLAMEAFKKSFTNPMAAIAAGAALMAVGAAVSAGLQKMTANPTGGGTSSYSGAGSYGSSEMMNYEQTLTVEVVGKISGSDIVLAGSKTQNKWNR